MASGSPLDSCPLTSVLPCPRYRDYRSAQDYNLSGQFWVLLAVRLYLCLPKGEMSGHFLLVRVLNRSKRYSTCIFSLEVASWVTTIPVVSKLFLANSFFLLKKQ